MQSTGGRLGQAGIRTSIALTVSALALAACAPDNTPPASQSEATSVQPAGPAISETSIVMAKDPGALGFSSEGFEKARADLQAGINDGVIPGGVLLVARGGEVVALETVGQQGPEDSTPMSEETIFRVYSMTKPIVSIATMQLVEEGKLSLSDPVSKYIPEYANLTVLEPDGSTRPATADMTVEHLLTHMSGLIYGVFDPESVLGQQYLAAGSSSNDITGLELSQTLAGLPLRSDPGAAWNYSRSTDVLGAVIEVADGRPLDELLDARIFTPLGMDDTHFYLPADKADRLAQPPTTISPLSTPLVEQPMLSGGAGLSSTTEDYFRFVEMLRGKGEYRGVRIIEEATLDNMLTDRITDGVDRSAWFYGPLGGFGLGFGLLPVDMADPSRGQYFSWGGYAGTNMWVDPQNDITMVFMIQNNEASDRFRALNRSWVYGGYDFGSADAGAE